MTIEPGSMAQGYLDFTGLGKLRTQARQDEKAALRETAEQFEAVFLQMMLKSMREAGFRSDLIDRGAEDVYQDLMDREVVVQMAKRRGFGVADMIERQLSQRGIATPPVASEVLGARQASRDAALPLRPDVPRLPMGEGRAAPSLPLPRDAPIALDRAPPVNPLKK